MIAPLLVRLVTEARLIYGSFATVAGMFYLVGQTLMYAVKASAVRYARLWPRALDLNRPDRGRRPRADPAGP